jgi:hypothetical protein
MERKEKEEAEGREKEKNLILLPEGWVRHQGIWMSQEEVNHGLGRQPHVISLSLSQRGSDPHIMVASAQLYLTPDICSIHGNENHVKVDLIG